MAVVKKEIPGGGRRGCSKDQEGVAGLRVPAKKKLNINKVEKKKRTRLEG